jgi:hypothetical protein
MTNDHIIKFAIADDHKIFRDGIKMALGDKENLKLLWEAEDGKDMMHKIGKAARPVAHGYSHARDRWHKCATITTQRV